MATATQISTRALKRLGVIDSGSTPAAADIADATDELNAMIASWEGKSLSGDVLPLDARFENPIVDMLALRMCPYFGITPSQTIKDNSDAGWSTISAAFFAVPESRFDDALKHTGHNSDYSYIIGDEEGDYENWIASTAYELRRHVINNANIYECITAGTSASSGGPTGTSAEITDGTVVWCWRRVTG